jgi:hypothetical protein
MAEGVVAQVTGAPGAIVSGVKNKPIAAVATFFFILLFILIVEAYKPGLFTGPVKKLLGAVGVKSA